MDRLTQDQRSAVMAAVRSCDTKPEMRVRRLLHQMGYRYRLHRKDLPGKPDIVFPNQRKIIFIHGCFWHRHVGCPNLRIPATNREYWIPKLKSNAKRDRKHMRELAKAGWRTLIIWECETSASEVLSDRLTSFMSEDA